jgi:hypothetical protein
MPYTPKDGDAKIIEQALQRFALAADAERDQRKRELEDLNFEFDPWPAEAKTARGGYIHAGVSVPARPMLNIPMLDQPLQLVINQEKAAHLGISVHPETEDADDDTAEVDQGLIRHIETRARANLARSWAFERAIRCGRGYYEIRKRYARLNAKGPEAFDQELYQARILNQASVYDDPWAVEPDKSDRLWAFKVEDVPHERYAQVVGKQGDLAGLNAQARQDKYADLTNNGAIFGSLGDDVPAWVTDKYCRIAEYWTVETTTRTETVGDQTREIEDRKILWRKINGVEVLDEVEWDGLWIPLIFVPGREFNIGGKRIWIGLVYKSKDSARLVNYAASTIAEKIAIDTKAAYMLAEGQEEGHEAEFTRAAVRPVPYVRYKPTALEGELNPPPSKNVTGPDLSADVQLLQQAKEFVHGATATFDPSLGNVSAKDRSGKAIVAQQQQSDSSNSDFLDNLGEVSMTYEARVLLSSIPKVYDRPGRLQEVINGKDESRKIILNHPFIEQPDPKNPNKKRPVPLVVTPQGPMLPGQNGGQPSALPQGVKVLHYDLSKGEYGVTVTVGKSYQTKMQQGLDTVGQLIQAAPELMPVLGWRWMQFNDSIPGHEEIAEDLKKLRPPQLQDDEQAEPEKLKQQLAQLGQQHEILVKELNAKNQIIETDQVKTQGDLDKAKIDQQTKIEVAKLERDTKIVTAAISAKVQDSKVLKEIEASAIELLMTQQAAAAEAEKARAHEAAMGAAGQAGDLEQGEAAHEQALEAGELDHSRAMEAGEAGHAQALEQQEQAAALAPDPAASE